MQKRSQSVQQMGLRFCFEKGTSYTGSMALPKKLLYKQRGDDSSTRTTLKTWSSRFLMIMIVILLGISAILFILHGAPSPTLTSPSLLEERLRTTYMLNRRLKYQYHSPEQRMVEHQIECGTKQTNYEAYFRMTFETRSEYNEDRNIYNLFFHNLTRHQMKDYHYMEIGAFDGIRESNTRFFDECLGWTGLLIEPNPKIYPALVKNRIHSHRMSYASSCSDEDEINNKTVTFYASWFTNAAEDLSVSREAYAKSDLATQVPCGSLSPTILDLFPTSKRIHFFSLDVESMEYQVLENIDFNSIFIDIIMAESVNPFCQKVCEGREKVRTFMKSKGYVLYLNTIRNSDIFVHEKSEFLLLMPKVEKMLPTQ